MHDPNGNIKRTAISRQKNSRKEGTDMSFAVKILGVQLSVHYSTDASKLLEQFRGITKIISLSGSLG